MKKIFTLYFICFSLIALFGQKNRHIIYFKSNESTLNSKHIKELDSLISTIVKNNSAKLLIIGHTDSIGTFDTNKKLSLYRASSIESHFLEKGIDKAKIQKDYYGYLFPVASNRKEAGRAKNRRTEIVVYTEKELQALDKARSTQIFTFKDNSKDLNIATKGGAIIRIPAKTLVSINKKASVEKVRIEVTEAYSLSDIFDNNLHTLSDQGILETDGMITIRAFDKNGIVNLKKDSTFYMTLPTTSKQNNTSLYVMNSDTGKTWSNPQLAKYMYSKIMGFYYMLNGDTKDTAKANITLRKTFCNKFLDTLEKRANYFIRAENLNYSYNVDRLIEKYGELTYDDFTVSIQDTLNLSYRLVLKDMKAVYYQNNSSENILTLKKIKSKKTFLVAYKYDILKNIVQYDVVDVTELKEVNLRLKTVTSKKYKTDLNSAIWN